MHIAIVWITYTKVFFPPSKTKVDEGNYIVKHFNTRNKIIRNGMDFSIKIPGHFPDCIMWRIDYSQDLDWSIEIAGHGQVFFFFKKKDFHPSIESNNDGTPGRIITSIDR